MNKSTIAISKNLRGMAEALDQTFVELTGERMGFTLVVYTEGRANFVSNIEREQTIEELKKLIEQLETGVLTPAHEFHA